MPRSTDGRVGQRAQGSDDRGELADVVQVGVDALEAAAPADRQPVVAERDLAPHPGQEVSERVSGLGGVVGPVGHPVTVPPVVAASAEERRGVGEVRLDLGVEGA